MAETAGRDFASTSLFLFFLFLFLSFSTEDWKVNAVYRTIHFYLDLRAQSFHSFSLFFSPPFPLTLFNGELWGTPDQSTVGGEFPTELLDTLILPPFLPPLSLRRKNQSFRFASLPPQRYLKGFLKLVCLMTISIRDSAKPGFISPFPFSSFSFFFFFSFFS